MTSKNAVRVQPKANNAPRSKVHTQFNNLIKKLEVERQRLAAWHDVMPRFDARLASELGSLDRMYFERTKQLVFVFDNGWEKHKLTTTEYAKLSHLICEMIADLRDVGMGEALEPLFAKHCGYDQLDGFDDRPEPEQLDQALKQFLDEAGLNPEPAPHGPDAGPNRDAAPPKMGVREARRAADEAKLQHSVRDVFRKLASSLHPDRETDPVERERKNALMQRANVAYAANDLLSLLELQFEIAQIDAASMESLGDDRIKQYIKTLKRQLAEVEVESEVLQEIMLGKLGLMGMRRITPKHLEQVLDAKIAKLQEDLEGIERDVVDFAEKKHLKAFLKNVRFDDDDVGFYP